MSSPVGPATTSSPLRLERGLLALVVVPAVAVLVVMGWSSGWGRGGGATGLAFLVAIAVANLVPFAVMAGVVIVGGRTFPRGMPVVVVGVVALAALTAVLLSAFVGSESSTAALLFLFLPVYLGLAVVATGALAVGLHWIRQRRGRRGTTVALQRPT